MSTRKNNAYFYICRIERVGVKELIETQRTAPGEFAELVRHCRRFAVALFTRILDLLHLEKQKKTLLLPRLQKYLDV